MVVGGRAGQQDPARCLGESVHSPRVHLMSSHVPPDTTAGRDSPPSQPREGPHCPRTHQALKPQAADLGFFI